MIGPKALPIRDVPRGCIAKSATRIATAAGRIKVFRAGTAILRPSRAERTEMAGVIAPSP